jgi:hypothetical protein
VFILEELLSPIVTPLILIFCLRPRALEIIDFFRNFTVEVVGVGDTCSFAQMDVRQHGHPQVLGEGRADGQGQCWHTVTLGKLQKAALSKPTNTKRVAPLVGIPAPETLFSHQESDWIPALI